MWLGGVRISVSTFILCCQMSIYDIGLTCATAMSRSIPVTLTAPGPCRNEKESFTTSVVGAVV